jgi:hypothetical protein
MSIGIGALLEAVQDALRTALVPHIPGEVSAQARNYVGVHPGGHPPATFADWYVSIDESKVESTEHAFLREVFSIDVFITKRMGKFAQDRQNSAYLQAINGLDPLESTIKTTIHNSHAVRAAACTLAGVPSAGNGDIFQHPLWFLGRARSMPKGPEWVFSEKATDQFLVRVLPFRGGTRVQAMDVAT